MMTWRMKQVGLIAINNSEELHKEAEMLSSMDLNVDKGIRVLQFIVRLYC